MSLLTLTSLSQPSGPMFSRGEQLHHFTPSGRIASFDQRYYGRATHESGFTSSGSAELAQFIQHWLCEHEDLKFSPSAHEKHQAWHSGPGETEMGDPWGLLTSQASQTEGLQVQ